LVKYLLIAHFLPFMKNVDCECSDRRLYTYILFTILNLCYDRVLTLHFWQAVPDNYKLFFYRKQHLSNIKIYAIPTTKTIKECQCWVAHQTFDNQ